MIDVERRLRYRLDVRKDDLLPALAWLARVDSARHVISVVAGSSVRSWDHGFFEGTWAGESDPLSISSSTTVFGSGILIDANGLPLVVTPSHTISGVFARRFDDVQLLSNSYTALLMATGDGLDPDFDYPGQFLKVTLGIDASPLALQTTKGKVDYHFYSNLRIAENGALKAVGKRREEPFGSYDDYRTRLSAMMKSALDNAQSYEPVVSVSSGYDSTAVAVLAAEHGCPRAFTFVAGRRTRRTGDDFADSGERTARQLGMDVMTFDRRAYRSRTDMPEAEFLATGMSGEDVIMSAFEPHIGRSVLLTGTMGNGIWKLGGRRANDMSRSALDGASLHEFRLRADFHFVPPAVFGQVQRASLMEVTSSAEMRPYSVGGHYDQPIPRRIAEDAGLPRSSFGVVKRAASAVIHSGGEAELSVESAAAIRAFAAAEGREVVYRPAVERTIAERAALRATTLIRLDRVSHRLAWRRRRLVHFEPRLGNLLLRWGVSVIEPRYASLREDKS